MSVPNSQTPPPAAPPAEPVVTPPVTPAPTINGGEDDDASLADHESQFGAEAHAAADDDDDDDAPPADPAAPPADDKTGKPKHRAKSQQATPGDAPRINELTKKWRDAERRATELEQKLRAQPAAAAPKPGEPAKPDPAKPFAFPELDDWLEQPGNQGKSWGAFQNARDDARDAWREAKAAQSSTAGTRTEAEAARKEADTAMMSAWNERTVEFKKEHADFETLLKAADTEHGDIPPLLGYAIVSGDGGPADLYTLLRNPALFDEMIAFTVDRPLSDASVAATRRLLKTRVQAAQPSGSAVPPRQPPIAPRPPNPLRTGPQKTSDDIPDDDRSLAEHERAFGDKGRRRR
jgi:hypothetical protein